MRGTRVSLGVAGAAPDAAAEHIPFHLIGQLQSNKIGKVLPWSTLSNRSIQSIWQKKFHVEPWLAVDRATQAENRTNHRQRPRAISHTQLGPIPKPLLGNRKKVRRKQKGTDPNTADHHPICRSLRTTESPQPARMIAKSIPAEPKLREK